MTFWGQVGYFRGKRGDFLNVKFKFNYSQIKVTIEHSFHDVVILQYLTGHTCVKRVNTRVLVGPT